MSIVALSDIELVVRSPESARPRRTRYRFVVDLEVDPDRVRDGRPSRVWISKIVGAHLRAALGTLSGHLSADVTWISGYRREVRDHVTGVERHEHR
jgi:hypothetical protein